MKVSDDDAATKTMMIEFHDNLLKGESKYDAFRKAQAAVMKGTYVKYGMEAPGTDPCL